MSTTVREGYEVEDLDPAAVLELATRIEREIREREFLKLRLAAQWAVLHPATADTGVETPGGAALLADESLGGDGTPLVAAFAPESFALALGMSPAAGAQLIADALDLRHRLPTLHQRVRRLQIPVWQARRVAQQTHQLSKPAAVWVDDQLAHRASCGPVVVDRLLAHAVAIYDPEDHQDREQQARAGWDVTLTHPDPTDYAGTSYLHATGDTLVLQDLYDLIRATAHQLRVDGDTDPLGVRKIKAIGLLTSQPQSTGTGPSRIKVHVHVEQRDLRIDGGGESVYAVGRVEKLGPATLTRIREWVGHHQVVIQPVLNMARRDAVDSHDPPGWMRDLVILRDEHCIFPRCTTNARSRDLDHTIAYKPDGPPGQTRPDNPARLCRRHHRATSSGRWWYLRTPDGDHQWHGPHNKTYLVTDRGTHRLP